VKPRWTNQSTGPVGPCANELPTEAPLATRWPRGQRLGPRIGLTYIRVLTRLTSVGNAACTFDIDTRPENWPTATLSTFLQRVPNKELARHWWECSNGTARDGDMRLVHQWDSTAYRARSLQSVTIRPPIAHWTPSFFYTFLRISHEISIS